MEQKYYIAKVGNLWVDHCFTGIRALSLGSKKEFATHIKQTDIDWLQKAIPTVEIVEVTVTIEETVV